MFRSHTDMSMVWLNTGVSVSVSDISLLATKLFTTYEYNTNM